MGDEEHCDTLEALRTSLKELQKENEQLKSKLDGAIGTLKALLTRAKTKKDPESAKTIQVLIKDAEYR